MFLQFCDKCLSVNPGLVKGNWGDFKSQLSEKDKSLSAQFKFQRQFTPCHKSCENYGLSKVYGRVFSKTILQSWIQTHLNLGRLRGFCIFIKKLQKGGVV